jgi:DNA segregation ATPase FtsK/SpoIIIE, S-DNA-T family
VLGERTDDDEEEALMKRALNFQADRIELVLASHKVPARVMGGTVTPRFVRFQVVTPLGVKVRQVAGLAEELALSLDAPSCRVYRQEGQVQVEVPRAAGRAVGLVTLCEQVAGEGGGGVPPVTAVLGLDEGGAPLLLRLPSPDVAHVLIAGTTGSGKTALARGMVASLALLNPQRAMQLVLIDPKGRGFGGFAGLPHLLVPVVTEVAAAAAVLGRLVAEMERRDAEGRSEPRLVVVLDELADLLLVGGQAMGETITRLTQRGREAGIHLVACTQKPTAALVGGVMKSNFPVRLVGSVASAEDARVAAGLGGTGAERLLGQGDFLVVVKGQVTRLQAAYLDGSELPGLVHSLRSTPVGPLPAVGMLRNRDASRSGWCALGRLAATGTDGEGSGSGRRILRLRGRR